MAGQQYTKNNGRIVYALLHLQYIPNSTFHRRSEELIDHNKDIKSACGCRYDNPVILHYKRIIKLLYINWRKKY